ncbi:MAG: ABC transporter ATP-binding protein [Gammaproteobacteria bacterium AqS3]|nr:ABC transporter ATP-binding protein [Gammaproteobacteria bacterium AqS3]
MSGAALRVQGLGFGYAGGEALLCDVDLDLEAGSVGCLLGASGVGKSTLLRLIAGLDRPDRGSISLGGETLFGPGRPGVPVHRRHIGMLLQDGALFPHLDVAGNVGFAIPRGPDRDARIGAWLERVGLRHLAGAHTASLSGGERARIALVRALASEPRLLLLDEPFAALDTDLRRQLAQDILALLRPLGVTVLMVTHDWAEALSLADRLGVMIGGSLPQWSTPQALYEAPASIEVARRIPGTGFLRTERGPDGAWRCAVGTLPAAAVECVGEVGAAGLLLVRSELLGWSDSGSARIVSRSYLGGAYRYRIELASGEALQMSERTRRPVGAAVGLHPAPGGSWRCYPAD